MWLTVAGVVGLTPLAAVFGAIVGPDLIGLVFGSDRLAPIRLGRCRGCREYGGPRWAVLYVVVDSRRPWRSRHIPWVGALVVGFVWATLGPGPPLGRVTWAFLVAKVVAFVLMHPIVSWTGAYGRPEGSPSSVVTDESATT